VSYSDLDLDGWMALSDERAGHVAADIARAVGAELVGLRHQQYAGRTFRLALFHRGGIEYSLVPGGEVTLGFDAERFTPTPQQAADYAEDAELYELPDLHTHLDNKTTPVRRVTLPALLVATEAVHAEELSYLDAVDILSEQGERLLTPDEWEYACGAGAPTLWRWGDDCPDHYEYSPMKAIWGQANLFGLVFETDERTAEHDVVCGGDGGVTSHAGAESFLLHLPHATAFREEEQANWLPAPDFADQICYRPVIPLKDT